MTKDSDPDPQRETAAETPAEAQPEAPPEREQLAASEPRAQVPPLPQKPGGWDDLGPAIMLPAVMFLYSYLLWRLFTEPIFGWWTDIGLMIGGPVLIVLALIGLDWLRKRVMRILRPRADLPAADPPAADPAASAVTPTPWADNRTEEEKAVDDKRRNIFDLTVFWPLGLVWLYLLYRIFTEPVVATWFNLGLLLSWIFFVAGLEPVFYSLADPFLPSVESARQKKQHPLPRPLTIAPSTSLSGVQDGRQSETDRLIHDLLHGDREEALRAAMALGAIGMPAVEPLLQAAGDVGMRARLQALKDTGQWRDADAGLLILELTRRVLGRRFP